MTEYIQGIPTDASGGLDSKFYMEDNLDLTKVMHFVLDDIEPSTTVELRIPPTGGILATREYVSGVENPQYFLVPTYSEMSYDSEGRIEYVDIWETDAKLLKLYTKHFTYNGTTGYLDQVVITRLADGKQSQKSLTYDTNGILIKVTNTVIG